MVLEQREQVILTLYTCLHDKKIARTLENQVQESGVDILFMLIKCQDEPQQLSDLFETINRLYLACCSAMIS